MNKIEKMTITIFVIGIMTMGVLFGFNYFKKAHSAERYNDNSVLLADVICDRGMRSIGGGCISCCYDHDCYNEECDTCDISCHPGYEPVNNLACFKKKETQEYFWGTYSGISEYERVDGINSFKECNKIVITKVDNKGNTLTAKAEITITKPDNSIEKHEVGSIVLNKLKAGVYKIEETKAPDGYQLDKTVITFTVSEEDGKITINDASNIHSKSSSATKNANISIKNNKLDNFCWKKTGQNGNEYEQRPTSPGEGWVKIENEKCDETPACYKKGNAYYVGKYDGIEGYSNVSNDVTKCNRILIRKVDNEGKQLTNKAEITITKPDKSTIKKEIGSITLANLEAGTYKIEETNAPEGYRLDKTVITFTVANDGKITVNNSSNVYSRSTSATLNANVFIKNILEGFCWKKTGQNGNEYKQRPTSPGEGWVKIENEKCDETPACYKKGNAYYVGKYDGIEGYSNVSNDVTKCNRILIRKVDNEGKQLTNKAEITITKPDKSTIKKEIGSITLANLEAGTYKIEETNAPEGYRLDKTVITFTVANDGKITVNNSSNVYSRSTSATLNANVFIKNILEGFCWKKTGQNGNEYKQRPTSPGEGWIKVENENCDEKPACYDNGEKYVWGKYENISGYTKIASIAEEDKCVKPIPACYKHKSTGKYSWGLYQDNSLYDLVPNVLEKNCHEVVPTPITASNISTTLLITMVLASIAGIGLIAYVKSQKI